MAATAAPRCQHAVCSLHAVHEEEKPFEIELSWICEESSNEFQRVPSDVVAEADRLAKAALEDSDMCARPCILSEVTVLRFTWSCVWLCHLLLLIGVSFLGHYDCHATSQAQ